MELIRELGIGLGWKKNSSRGNSTLKKGYAIEFLA